MTSFARRHAREIIRGVVHLWWVFVIVLPLTGFGLWLAVDHANANAARLQRQTNVKFALQQKRSNQQFRQSQILANRKFQQATRISIGQSAYAQNKSACGWRGFLKPTLSDNRIPEARRRQIAVFLESQVTVPSDFDCADLPKNPPKATP